MDYIQESLTGSEKVLMIGRFHWIYMIGAFFWVAFGVLLCAGILTAGVVWDVRSVMNASFPNLPANLFWQGWGQVVDSSGGYVDVIRNLHIAVRGAAFFALLVGIGLFAQMMIVRATTEIAVTSSRLVLKEGVIARNVDEMSIDRIESVHVIQSIVGRMFNFGTVMVRGMGVGEIMLPPLADPVSFRNALETARQMHDKAKAA